MSPELISICVLMGMFVLATMLPINMGVIAFVGAFLVGTLVAGMNAKAIISGFPAELFLTLVGITYLFALAQNNGTIDWLVKLALRAVRGRVAAIPWVMFFIAAVLTSVGAVSPAAVAIIAPIALGFAAKYGINPADGFDGDSRRTGRRLLADQYLRRHHQQDRCHCRSAAQRSRHHPGQLRHQFLGRAAAVLCNGRGRLLEQRAVAPARILWRMSRRTGRAVRRSTAMPKVESLQEERRTADRASALGARDGVCR